MRESDYSDFIYKRTYARWIPELKRRENWNESVDRYVDFFVNRVPVEFQPVFREACDKIYSKAAMPSMRALWSAGPALEKENIAGYNCSYLPVNNPRVFAEMLYILMCGTGVGFSVERQCVNQLPFVPHNPVPSTEPIVFKDSKLGWAEGYNRVIKQLYSGVVPTWDLSKIRPAGSLLKTFGGRASGPGPLEELIQYTVRLFNYAQGRCLTSLECHDLCCAIASAVIVGGVRRSACISLSNLSDDRMAKCKTGEFWVTDPQRALANNSVAYTDQPDARKFLSEWLKLIESKTGERGIFNRVGAKSQIAKIGRREVKDWDFGTNPCGEIILRPNEFCNLTEVIIRPEDELDTLKEKVRAATILGSVQSTLTDFRFIRKDFQTNCEEERLLGVSLTGLRDHVVLCDVNPIAEEWLRTLEGVAIETAKEWAGILGIPVPAAITCIKPSGTVSQLVGCSSGLHTRYSPYYIRRVRVSALDPIARLLIDQGFPWNPENGQMRENCSIVVFDFPQEAPSSAITNADVSALDQLEYWKMLQECWCEHNPSCTIHVKDHEWPEVGAWVYKHWDSICGLSFLPADTGVYKLAPYEEIDRDTYDRLVANLPDINFNLLHQYEHTDLTDGSREYACVGGRCEI